MLIFKKFYIRLLHFFARNLFPSAIRVFLHKLRGVSIGKNVFIGLNVFIDDFSPNKVIIEDNVFITSDVMLLTHKRNLKSYKKNMWIGDCTFTNKRIFIRKGAHIGVRSVILPGVQIGEGAVIGAGSIVTKNIPPYSLAIGVPAIVVKTFVKNN